MPEENKKDEDVKDEAVKKVVKKGDKYSKSQCLKITIESAAKMKGKDLSDNEVKIITNAQRSFGGQLSKESLAIIIALG